MMTPLKSDLLDAFLVALENPLTAQCADQPCAACDPRREQIMAALASASQAFPPATTHIERVFRSLRWIRS